VPTVVALGFLAGGSDHHGACLPIKSQAMKRFRSGRPRSHAFQKYLKLV
jgi:hypothetical protein